MQKIICIDFLWLIVEVIYDLSQMSGLFCFPFPCKCLEIALE